MIVNERVTARGLEPTVEDNTYVRHLPISLDTIQRVQAVIDRNVPEQQNPSIIPTQTTGEQS